STELSGQGAVATLTTWQPYGLVAAGFLALLLVQSAFQAAPLQFSLPILTVADPVVSVVIGAVAFGESIRASPVEIVLEAVGMLVLAKGVFLLGRSPLVAGEGGPPTGNAQEAPI
ncbi:MAG: DMT family transporter, partial [Acidimicrobiales bacterium]